MGTVRVKQEEETETRIMQESSKKSVRKDRGHKGESIIFHLIHNMWCLIHLVMNITAYNRNVSIQKLYRMPITFKLLSLFFLVSPSKKKTFKINITPKLIKINGLRKQSCVLLRLKSYKVTFKGVNIAIN